MTVDSEGCEAIRQSLATEGFVVIRGAVDPDYCIDVARDSIAAYGRLKSNGWGSPSGGRFAGHLAFGPSVHGPAILSALRQKGYFADVEAAAGNAFAVGAYVGNMNLPGSHDQEIHQDWNPPNRNIVMNVLLTETTPENGATEIVPRAAGDRYGYRTLHSTGALERSVYFTGHPGDLLIRWATAWHRGKANRTSSPRPMFGVILEPAVQQVPDPPCDEPIGFWGNRFYGRYALLRELTAVYCPQVMHTKRILFGVGS